jgi:hypothetical protein
VGVVFASKADKWTIKQMRQAAFLREWRMFFQEATCG